MSIEVTMPRLSDTMERGTVVSWNVKVGDAVTAGVALGDIETDKATMELQSFDSGTVAALLIKQGETVEVGRPILVIAEEGEDLAKVKSQYSAGAGQTRRAEDKPRATAASSAEKDNAGSTTAVAEPPAHTNGGTNGHGGSLTQSDDDSRVFASPLAKKIAAEMGVDLAGLTGSGPAGRVLRRDVEGAAVGGGTTAKGAVEHKPSAAKKPAPVALAPLPGAKLEKRTAALNNMRATIAKRLVQSKTTIPHYQVTVTVNMDLLSTLREQLNGQLESQGVKLSVNDFLVRACALAMHEHPFINSSWGANGQSIDLHDRINIGVAISLPMEKGGGLVVATLRDADRMGLRQISADTRSLASKARDRGLTIDEMDGATFTISNLGMYGVEHFTAIINPPNSAILAVGAAVEKPVVRDGAIVVGREMQMTMSSDHRVIDGAMAAQYLQSVKKLLEAPATLLV